MYPKGGNMLHTIRHIINNDTVFRNILRGLNKDFYHETVTTKQVEDYFSEKSKINLSKVFNQYLRSTEIPVLEYYYTNNNKTVYYHWSNCIKGFNMPLTLTADQQSRMIYPTEKWQQMKDISLFDTAFITRNYYIILRQVQPAQ